MQDDKNKSLQIITEFSKIITELRTKDTNLSINQFAYGYGLDKGNLSRIENGSREPKLLTIWKLAEGFNMKPSQLFSLLESRLGEDFTLIDK